MRTIDDREMSAHFITAAAMEMAHDIEESEAFVSELLRWLRGALGFDSAVAAGPALGRSMVTIEVAPRSREGAVRFLEAAEGESRAAILGLLRHRFEYGVCLEEEHSGRSRPAPYRELMTRSAQISMACVGLAWRGAPLAFLELARYGGRQFGEAELSLLRSVKPSLEVALMANIASSEPRIPEKLTPREREIAQLVCRGLSNREIGGALGSSPHTVRNQTGQIYRKAGVDNRVELTALLSAGPSLACSTFTIEGWLSSFRASA